MLRARAALERAQLRGAREEERLLRGAYRGNHPDGAAEQQLSAFSYEEVQQADAAFADDDGEYFGCTCRKPI